MGLGHRREWKGLLNPQLKFSGFNQGQQLSRPPEQLFTTGRIVGQTWTRQEERSLLGQQSWIKWQAPDRSIDRKGRACPAEQDS
jgi:hypothetical protein